MSSGEATSWFFKGRTSLLEFPLHCAATLEFLSFSFFKEEDWEEEEEEERRRRKIMFPRASIVVRLLLFVVSHMDTVCWGKMP